MARSSEDLNATSDQTAEIYYKVCNKFFCLINYLKEILF
jgi:hypothetical protein